ncbi:hypothetical protein [Epibacterium sp. Ofav1-8]|uniref:hypothetical protein n=1 Tax=Epibacterium sp. Ofav1-8 TaxID=2917735 RepID=UPI001EF51213|nr:hypothetical protein [Epibacterium sp. Ofav1-8]MCG7625561.1 hypothetical protein [Epibacterium sp. Ofav1-8]
MIGDTNNATLRDIEFFQQKDSVLLFRMIAAAALLLTAACTPPNPVVSRQSSEPTAQQARQIEDGVKNVLKDPFSAHFRNLRVEKRTLQSGETVTVACGQVNSKNSFGAYVGFRTFIGALQKGNFRPYTLDAYINMFEAKDHCS